MTNRYAQLIELAELERPQSVLEIGVHGAIRAVKICRSVLQQGLPVHYIGFDVFETMSEEFQVNALNGKGMATEARARARLDNLKNQYPTTFTYELVIGDTTQTLKDRSFTADLAFIDGDHRAHVVKSDYEAVKDSKIIVFDDYYAPDSQGRTPDLDKYGANSIVESIIAQGQRRVIVLPVNDECRDSGVSHLVVVR